ncbi:hypothetical protein [Agrobacterium pusense]
MTEQTPSLAALAEEQKSLELTKFNYELAWELGKQIRERALT